jgi:hypothetical protein
MDVDNRSLEEDGGRTQGEDGFPESDAGAAGDAGEYIESAPHADSEAPLSDEAEEIGGEEQLAAAGNPEIGEEADLPDDVYEIDPSPHSLLSVLFPAKPPRPRNARIVRLFDLEAAKNDPEPGEEPVVEQPPKEEPRTREAIKAARNQSLLVAARLR